MWRLARWLFNMAATFYGMVATAYTLLKFAVGDTRELTFNYNVFVHLLWMPALVLLPISVYRRNKIVSAVLALPAAVFIISYMPLFLPRFPNIPANAREFTLATFNIYKDAYDHPKTIETIREMDADIVNLQELTNGAAQMIFEELSVEYPYMALHPNRRDPAAGQGVLSRYPILEDEYWVLRRGHQRVSIDLEGTEIVLYNTHPHQTFASYAFEIQYRTREIENVLERAAQEEGPVIIAGDFNMTDQTDDYSRVTANYTDAFRAMGWGLGFTFPDTTNQRRPLLPLLARIDYIFYNEQIAASQVYVWHNSGGSDHRPIWAKLALLP